MLMFYISRSGFTYDTNETKVCAPTEILPFLCVKNVPNRVQVFGPMMKIENQYALQR